MRSTFLPFALPDIGETEIQQVAETLQSGWVTSGPKTHEFEAQFAQAVEAQFAVAVNSCTAAMHLALEAVGVKAGDLVLTSPYTFAATAEVIRYFNATPIFVDIDPATLNIDPHRVAETAEALMDRRGQHKKVRLQAIPGLRSRRNGAEPGRLKAILPVHFGGLPAEVDKIYDVANRHRLAVIEDAAHAFPARYQDHMIGSTDHLRSGSDSSTPNSQPSLRPTTPNSALNTQNSKLQAACFSFYATKTITTGEGGMICTNNPNLAERCRVMALHGISKDAWNRYAAEGSWYYEIVAPGFKYNMSDIAAALGLAQLQKAQQMWRRRQAIACRYHQAFNDIPELQLPADRPDCQHAWHLYPLRLNLERLAISRREFIAALKERNIGTSVHFIPLHIHPYYRQTYGYHPADFPVAYTQFKRVISLPIYSKMSEQDVEDVIQAVLESIGRYYKPQIFSLQRLAPEPELSGIRENHS